MHNYVDVPLQCVDHGRVLVKHAQAERERLGACVQGSMTQLRVRGQLLLGPGADLIGVLVPAARPGPGLHQPFQPGGL